ncbi:hypothetical protein SUGI_1075690 [Cryptomeria japonica]|nr:hypothetical protein SUGI_1075690 [Cryptomeria japonica]
MDCGVIAANRILLKKVTRKLRRGTMPVDVPYQQLSALRFKEDLEDEETQANAPHVSVVVGKERRVFKVDPQIVKDAFFRVLLDKGTMMEEDNFADGHRCMILLEQCDSILFEHILWLVYNDDPSIPSVNLEELIEFYAQDAP